MGIKPSDQDSRAVKLAQALRAWAEQLLSPAHREQQRLIAQERRIRYLAHIEAGFTEAQALELCKT